MMGSMRSAIGLIVAVVVSQLAGVIGSIFTTSSIGTWYAQLTKPTFNPPGWIFAPVWTILYTLMGVAAWIVWKSGADRGKVRTALVLFAVQLVLNTLWSIIFFGLHSPGWAFLEILLLWVAILATIIHFFRVSTVAGALLVPYLLWVSFAAVLNYNIWQLNR